ncbi:MAG: hypothetical protein AVDCRST_MAG49-1586 [uncultured Thermomicrobiales bacterium]|uniref:Uncharacterized protein n=1 Tax=uncultured Thermomicrobiales bacterium TaxID=1645740 RepID=A0A6J4UH83_9BACT|nr:MAG: hypothetical protein AVDCRST_MAG49-1586 [uncultured Thermomicrobiales bacterium]
MTDTNDRDHAAPGAPARSIDELLASDELERAAESGEITYAQADEMLQQAERRRAAEEGPASDTDAAGRITQGGFGSGNRGDKQASGNG